MLVLEEEDTINLEDFLEKLRRPPYLLRFQDEGSANAKTWVRQLRFYAVAEARQLPYNTP